MSAGQDNERAERVRAAAAEVFAAGAWYLGVEQADCPGGLDELWLNAVVGVVRLLFIEAEARGVNLSVVIQGVGLALGGAASGTPVEIVGATRALLMNAYETGLRLPDLEDVQGSA